MTDPPVYKKNPKKTSSTWFGYLGIWVSVSKVQKRGKHDSRVTEPEKAENWMSKHVCDAIS
jgi:hypothetical protein